MAATALSFLLLVSIVFFKREDIVLPRWSFANAEEAMKQFKNYRKWNEQKQTKHKPRKKTGLLVL